MSASCLIFRQIVFTFSENSIFQLDGIPVHLKSQVELLLDLLLRCYLIKRSGPISLPFHLPFLTLLGFFMCDFVRGNTYHISDFFLTRYVAEHKNNASHSSH